MLEDRDPLLRQIRKLAVAIAARLLGRSGPVDEAETIRAEVGLDPDVAARLALPALLTMLTTTDGLDAGRALLLGLGLLARARDTDDPALHAKARGLVDAALRARPTLRTAEVEAALG